MFSPGDPRLPLLHDHRPEDDPRRTASGAACTPSAIGLLAALLIAPQTTEFATQGRGARRARARLRGASAARAARGAARSRGWSRRRLAAGRRSARWRRALAGAVAFVGLLVLAGIPARSSAQATLTPIAAAERAPRGHRRSRRRASRQIDRRTAQQIARDVVADLRSRVGRASAARREPRDRGRERRLARGALAADPGRERDARSSSRLPRRPRSRHPGARRGPGAADGRRAASTGPSTLETYAGSAAGRHERERAGAPHADDRARARAAAAT